MIGSDLVDRICLELLLDADNLGERAVARIRHRSPEYGVVDPVEHATIAAAEMRKVIGGFRDRRTPEWADVRAGSDRGRRRALEGVPIETMLGGYDIGFDVLWNELCDRVSWRDVEREADLLPMVNILMAWSRGITGAVAEGYAMATARDERLALARAFINGLTHGGVGSGSLDLAARGLGFAPTGTFQVICAAAEDWTSEALQQLRGAMRGPAAVVMLGGTLTVTVQGIPVTSVLALLGEHTVAGVGLPRPGLAGAAESLIDAERALTLAYRRGAPVHFEQDWLLATLLPQAERLAPLTRHDAGRAHPHLAEAVRAYAGNHFSITAGAESLDLHANTVKYRLSRWHEITGWDPRTLDGLMRSLISLAAPEHDGNQRGDQSR